MYTNMVTLLILTMLKSLTEQPIIIKDSSLKRGTPLGTLTQETIILTFRVFTPLFSNLQRLASLLIALDICMI